LVPGEDKFMLEIEFIAYRRQSFFDYKFMAQSVGCSTHKRCIVPTKRTQNTRCTDFNLLAFIC